MLTTLFDLSIHFHIAIVFLHLIYFIYLIVPSWLDYVLWFCWYMIPKLYSIKVEGGKWESCWLWSKPHVFRLVIFSTIHACGLNLHFLTIFPLTVKKYLNISLGLCLLTSIFIAVALLINHQGQLLYSFGWYILTIAETPYSQQSCKVSESFPYKWINKKWKEGFHVTSMATAGYRWGVVMSRNSRYSNQVISIAWPYGFFVPYACLFIFLWAFH